MIYRTRSKTKYEIPLNTRKMVLWQVLRHRMQKGQDTRDIKLQLAILEAPELFRKHTPIQGRLLN